MNPYLYKQSVEQENVHMQILLLMFCSSLLQKKNTKKTLHQPLIDVMQSVGEMQLF